MAFLDQIFCNVGVNSVWKWESNKWALYLPGQDTEAYAISKGFEVLSTINEGEGFWINAIEFYEPDSAEDTGLQPNQAYNGEMTLEPYVTDSYYFQINLVPSSTTEYRITLNASGPTNPSMSLKLNDGNFNDIDWDLGSSNLCVSSGLSSGQLYQVQVSSENSGTFQLLWEKSLCGDGADEDITAPMVLNVTPSDGSIGVGTTAAITITFNETMDATTITSEACLLFVGDNKISVPVHYDTSTKTATLTPVGNLFPNTVYKAEISAFVKDLSGNGMGSPYSFSFTTADYDENYVHAAPDPAFDNITWILPTGASSHIK